MSKEEKVEIKPIPGKNGVYIVKTNGKNKSLKDSLEAIGHEVRVYHRSSKLKTTPQES